MGSGEKRTVGTVPSGGEWNLASEKLNVSKSFFFVLSFFVLRKFCPKTLL